MGDLTPNLSRSEFACRCGCGFDTVDIGLPAIIQGAADHFAHRIDAPVRVEVSGPNRCVQHNKDVGGADDSEHLYARAGDIKLFIRHSGKQIDPDLVADHLESEYPSQLGIGRYDGRTHVDNRTNGPARWDNR